MAYTWPTRCPVCSAQPDQPCVTSNNYHRMKDVHVARVAIEWGPWTRKYDSVYRDQSLKFNLKYKRAA